MSENDEPNDFKKVLAVLKQFYGNAYPIISEVLSASRYKLDDETQWHVYMARPEFSLTFLVQHSIFIKHADYIDTIIGKIEDDLPKFSNLRIKEVKIKIDYDKFEIIESTIKPIQTDWEEINENQTKLFQQLASSSDSLDLQHIGNISRTIMQKLSDVVYVHEKHKPEASTIAVTPEKFKNRLTSYIIKELAGEKNKELRHLAEALIASVEKTIDLANTITHKTDVDKTFAEVCVIGTIGAISIIKLIHKKSEPTK
jgi:hypothetical protein